MTVYYSLINPQQFSEGNTEGQALYWELPIGSKYISTKVTTKDLGWDLELGISEHLHFRLCIDNCIAFHIHIDNSR